MADDALFCEKCGAIIASRAKNGTEISAVRESAEKADRQDTESRKPAEEADRQDTEYREPVEEAGQMKAEAQSPEGTTATTEWTSTASQGPAETAEQGMDSENSRLKEHFLQSEPDQESRPRDYQPQRGPNQTGLPQEHTMQNSTNPPVKKKSTPIVIIVACIVIAAIIAAAVLMGGQEKPVIKADLMSQNNFNNGAIFAYDDSNLYFVADYEGESLENDLYSTDYDGNSKKLLFSDGYVRKVRVTDGKVLFTYTDKAEKDHFYIGMVNPDGTDAVTITDLKAEITDYDLNGKELLFLADEELHSCSLDGSNDKVLLSDVKEFVNAGSMLYYASSDGVYSYTRKKGKSAKLFDGEISELCCGDERFYFRRDDAYFMTDSEVNEKKLVDDRMVHFMLFKGQYIYFVRMYDKGKMDVLLGQGWEDTDYKYLAGVGPAVRIPKDGGALEELGDKNKEDLILGTTLFGYPDGMYLRTSIVLNTLTPVENVPAD